MKSSEIEALQNIHDKFTELDIPSTYEGWDIYINNNGQVYTKEQLGYCVNGKFILIDSVSGIEDRSYDPQQVDGRNALQYDEPFCKDMVLNFLRAKKGGYGNSVRASYGVQKLELNNIDIGLQRSEQGTILVTPNSTSLQQGLSIGGIYTSNLSLGRQIKSSEVLTQLFNSKPSPLELDKLIAREKDIIQHTFAIILKYNSLNSINELLEGEKSGYDNKYLLGCLHKVYKEIEDILNGEKLVYSMDILWSEAYENNIYF